MPYDVPIRLHGASLSKAPQIQICYRCHSRYIQNQFSDNPPAHEAATLLLPQQLIRFFIYAYHWNRQITRHFIKVQDVLHAGYEFCVFFGWDAPVDIFVKSKFIFLRMAYGIFSDRNRSAGHLNAPCLNAPVHLAPCGTGIRTDIVADNILYVIFNIRLNNICYGGMTDRITMGNLDMCKACTMNFIRFKKYLASL